MTYKELDDMEKEFTMIERNSPGMYMLFLKNKIQQFYRLNRVRLQVMRMELEELKAKTFEIENPDTYKDDKYAKVKFINVPNLEFPDQPDLEKPVYRAGFDKDTYTKEKEEILKTVVAVEMI